ncbi:acetyl-coenzyme A synthetase-like [Thrips palmi]|uniref:Acetyl-coenzyme A synthetase-like n=1 Tax=Thrips palmi TaxID=161013 RepID=A0A6P9A7J1_THRPL|nr:acetyl-coenzyme A synthetase-like [Thrips palmi]
MTETTFTTFCGEVRADKPGSPGTLVSTMECKVVDTDTGKTLPMGSRGELCFKGSMVMRGYLNNADATSEAFDAEGWLRSGDLGFVDEDGYYYVVERLKDVLKYNGHQVSPSELEALLITHPAVSEAAVVGVPHEYGDAPRALVMLAEGHHVAAEDLQEFIQGKVAPHKQLRGGIVFVTSPFPRTASGKLQRKKLNAMLANGADDSMTSSSGAGSVGEPSLPNSPVPEQPKAATTTQRAEAPTPADLKDFKDLQISKADAEPVSVPQTQSVSYAAVAAVTAPRSEDDERGALKDTSTPKRLDEDQREAQGAESDATPEIAVSPEFLPHKGHRPSVVSTTSLSTIYSQSPLESPVLSFGDASAAFGDNSAFASPSIAALKEAAKVPLPSPSNTYSEVNGSQLYNGSQGSCDMDLTCDSPSTA